MKSYVSHSLEQTREIANEWLSGLGSNVSGEATVVGLSGHLGAGKTAFVKMVAKELGVKEVVTSPTFVIMKIYEIDSEVREQRSEIEVPWKRLVHIDAYRLERPEEMGALNFEQLVADPHNLIFVEWPENVGLNKNPELIQLRFEVVESKYCINI